MRPRVRRVGRMNPTAPEQMKIFRYSTAGSLLALGLTLAAPSITQAQTQAQIYDVIIRNGRVIDGTGNPWFLADVALDGDRIVAIGNLQTATAGRDIDATGLYVTPGFIDAHSHAGPGLATAGLSHGEPLLAQGLTTVVINPDGGGPVDLARQRSELLRDGLGLNAAQLVPHGSIRGVIMGAEDRAPTAGELEEMIGLVRRGMEEGAFGWRVSTAQGPWPTSARPWSKIWPRGGERTVSSSGESVSMNRSRGDSYQILRASAIHIRSTRLSIFSGGAVWVSSPITCTTTTSGRS